MNSKKKILIIAVVFVLLLAGAFLLYNKLSGSVAPDQLAAEDEAQNQDEESDGQQAKVKAPDFVVYDKDGNKVGLSDYLGKPVVLNFWASWCGPCASEMPDFEEAYKERGDEIQFLMVNLTDGYQETMESATEYIQEQGFTFPVFYDTESNAANTYATYSIPMTFFIDSEGYMVARATGALDSATLKKGLDMIE
jgi:thiol-disulfide isomerase/thioredoxin